MFRRLRKHRMGRDEAMRIASYFSMKMASIGFGTHIYQSKTTSTCYVTNSRGGLVVRTRISDHDSNEDVETVFSLSTAKIRFKWLRHCYGKQ